MHRQHKKRKYIKKIYADTSQINVIENKKNFETELL